MCDVSDAIHKVYALADIAERRTFYTGMMPECYAISNKDLLAGKSSKKTTPNMAGVISYFYDNMWSVHVLCLR